MPDKSNETHQRYATSTTEKTMFTGFTGRNGLFLDSNKVDMAKEGLENIKTTVDNNVKEILKNKLDELNECKGITEALDGNFINVQKIVDVIDYANDGIDAIILQIEEKQRSMEAYASASDEEIAKATWKMFASKFVDGFLGTIEEIGDGILVLGSFICVPACGEKVDEWFEKRLENDWSSDVANKLITEEEKKISRFTEDSGAANLSKGFGTMIGYIGIGAATGGVGSLATKGASAAGNGATLLKAGGTFISNTKKAETAIAALGGLGAGTSTGVKQGKTIEESYVQGVGQALLQGGLAWGSITAVEKLSTGAKVASKSDEVLKGSDNVTDIVGNSVDDVTTISKRTADDVTTISKRTADDIINTPGSTADDLVDAVKKGEISADDAKKAASEQFKKINSDADEIRKAARAENATPADKAKWETEKPKYYEKVKEWNDLQINKKIDAAAAKSKQTADDIINTPGSTADDLFDAVKKGEISADDAKKAASKKFEKINDDANKTRNAAMAENATPADKAKWENSKNKYYEDVKQWNDLQISKKIDDALETGGKTSTDILVPETKAITTGTTTSSRLKSIGSKIATPANAARVAYGAGIGAISTINENSKNASAVASKELRTTTQEFRDLSLDDLTTKANDILKTEKTSDTTNDTTNTGGSSGGSGGSGNGGGSSSKDSFKDDQSKNQKEDESKDQNKDQEKDTTKDQEKDKETEQPSTPTNPDKPDTPDVPDTPDTPENPDKPDAPNTPKDPSTPGSGGGGTHYTGGGYSGSQGYVSQNGDAGTDTTIEDILDDSTTSIDDVIKGSNYNKIPTSSDPITSKSSGGSMVIPIAAGLSAAAAAGIGAKAYLDRKNNNDNGETDDIETEEWENQETIDLEYAEDVEKEQFLDDDDEFGYQEEEPAEKYGARSSQEIADLQ